MTKTLGQTLDIRIGNVSPVLLLAFCCAMNFLQPAYAQGSDEYSSANGIDNSQASTSQPRDYDSVHRAGMNAYKQGEDELAEKLLIQSVQMAKDFPEDDPRVLESAHDLGQFYYMTFKYAKADICFQQVLEISQKTLNPSDPRIGDALSDVVMVWRHLGKGDKVEPLLKKALKIRYESLGVSDIKVANTLLDLATFYEDNNQLAQSAMYYKKAIQLKEDILGSGSPKIDAIRTRYANILTRLGIDDSTIATASVLPGGTPGTGSDEFGNQNVSSVSTPQSKSVGSGSEGDNMKIEMSSDDNATDNFDSSTGTRNGEAEIEEGESTPIPRRSSASAAQASQPVQAADPANSNMVK